MHGKPKLRRPTASRPLLVVSATLLALVGCQESRDVGASQEMAWARVALERNPSLELIATDTDEGVFTVRDRRTGQVHAVRLDDIAAAPIAVLTATGPETDADAPADQVAQEIPVEDAYRTRPRSSPTPSRQSRRLTLLRKRRITRSSAPRDG